MAGEFDPDFVNEFELETWSRCAAEYLDGFAGMTRETFPMLVEAAQIGSGQDVLDVGSGPGHICGALTSIGCSAAGVDFSSEMVKIASSKYPESTFYHSNAEDLPFEDGSFDSAISNFVVHHLARPEAVFRQIARVLKKKGKFAYSVFAAPETQSSIGAFFSAVEEHHVLEDLPHGPLFGVEDPDIHTGLLKAGGFEEAQFETRSIVWRTETPEPVLDSFRDWGNLAAFPKETSRKIAESTLKNLEVFRAEDGYEFPHQVLIASAVRL